MTCAPTLNSQTRLDERLATLAGSDEAVLSNFGATYRCC